jgi:hypothetical protein
MVSIATFSPTDRALFESFLAHGMSADHFAAAAGDPTFSIVDAIYWLNLPHITALRRGYQAALEEAVNERLARARITAIETLNALCTARIDPSDRRRAATTIMSAARAQKIAAKPAKPTNPTPRPTKASAPTPSAPTPSAPTSTAPAAPLPAAAPAPAPSTPAPTSTPSASDLSDPSDLSDLSELSAQADDDLKDIINDCMDDLLDDEALDREADEIEARLGVPLTHPEIMKAVTEGRVDELDAIAATIRARDA